MLGIGSASDYFHIAADAHCWRVTFRGIWNTLAVEGSIWHLSGAKGQANSVLHGNRKLYLEIVKKKQTTREIAEALQKGGMESTSKKNWITIVHAALARARKAGALVKVGSQWGLTGWYPKGVITAQQPDKGAKKSSKATKAKQTKAAAKAKTEQNVAASIAPQKIPIPITRKKGATAERAIQILKSKPGMEPQQLAKQLGLDVKVKYMLLANLVKSSKAEKMPSGNYRAATAMPQATHAVV
jgi:hypothetical protein